MTSHRGTSFFFYSLLLAWMWMCTASMRIFLRKKKGILLASLIQILDGGLGRGQMAVWKHASICHQKTSAARPKSFSFPTILNLSTKSRKIFSLHFFAAKASTTPSFSHTTKTRTRKKVNNFPIFIFCFFAICHYHRPLFFVVVAYTHAE